VSEKERFWEERFYAALKRRAIDVGRAMRSQSDPLVRIDDDEDPPADGPLAVPESRITARIDEARIMEALRRLAGPRGKAAWLAWVEGWPIESRNPEELTVAKAMGISGRMVRRHLAEAREALKDDPAIAEALAEMVGR
jgi:DNA-directed RNA polymerase specialized sigma24 family protein